MQAADILPAIAKLGINEVELMSNHAEAIAGAPAAPPRGAAGAPPNPAQDKFRQDTSAWRASAETMNKYHDLRKQFDDAGINLGILCYNMNGNIVDDEIDYAFRMAQALGVRSISSSSTVTIAKRVAPFADKYKMIWAGHGHDDVNDPEQFAKPETFEKIMSFSPYIRVNLDIGHFTAAGYDAVGFIRRYHDKITNLHLKDRVRNPPGTRTGGNLRWGDGETPIREVLQLLRREQYGFPANIEYEYQGTDPVIEVAKCLQYAKDILLG
jgi:sugar phosphate isomerase/epimerase